MKQIIILQPYEEQSKNNHLLPTNLYIFTGFVAHKFYVSTTKVEYVKEKKSIQIISKIFVEDLEQVLQERYSSRVQLDPKRETELDQNYLIEYVLQKLKFKVNGNDAPTNLYW